MVVQHNIASMNANRYYNINNSGLSKSLEKLSSGYQINRAGDNAAGLAVSEKMRSQIGGLTQGVKNAQDGISMIQTYEGALTETDAILQRMKTLADQSANGTYQNEVDREAIQLEFNQLNDELDQIADTDFNGVVMLNGGQMADGLKAVDGKFDYANRTRDAKQLSANDINKVDYQIFDDKTTTTGLKTKADDVWKAISNNTWDRSDLTKDQGPESVDITLKYDTSDSTNPWKVDNATNGANKDTITVTKTANGGFSLTAGTVKFANVVLDATELVNGDTITLTLNNPYAGISAPTNAGAIVTDTSKYTEDGGAASSKAKDINLAVAVDTGLTDAKMTESAKKILDAFDGASIDVAYASEKEHSAADTKVTYTLSDGTKATLAATGVDGSTKLTLKDGTEYSVKSDAGVLTVYEGDNNGTALLTLTLGSHGGTGDKSAGTISYKIGVEYKNYDTSKLPTIEVKAPDASNVSEPDAYAQATAPLTYTDHLTLQAGARTKDSVDFTFKYDSEGLGDLKANMNCSSRTDGLGTKDLSLLTQKDANKAIDKIDNAINKVSMVRATFGATQNRLEHKIDNMNVTKENITSAESRIRDTDVSEEMANFTKNQILSQASQSMLAQANSLPQNVLQLLG